MFIDGATFENRWLRSGVIAAGVLSLALLAGCEREPEPQVEPDTAERTAPPGDVRMAPPAEEPVAPAEEPVPPVAEEPPPVADAPPPAEEPVAEAPAAPAGGDVAAGKQVYDRFCVACHATGAAGAPMLGQGDAWAPRIDKGMDTMVQNTITGIGAMPPRGTCFQCSDEELANAVAFMVGQVQ
jgi:cytochrome c5